jgi:hypothetical protein
MGGLALRFVAAIIAGFAILLGGLAYAGRAMSDASAVRGARVGNARDTKARKPDKAPKACRKDRVKRERRKCDAEAKKLSRDDRQKAPTAGKRKTGEDRSTPEGEPGDSPGGGEEGESELTGESPAAGEGESELTAESPAAGEGELTIGSALEATGAEKEAPSASIPDAEGEVEATSGGAVGAEGETPTPASGLLEQPMRIPGPSSQPPVESGEPPGESGEAPRESGRPPGDGSQLPGGGGRCMVAFAASKQAAASGGGRAGSCARGGTDTAIPRGRAATSKLAAAPR